ncbi:hypothetical protein BGZ82_003555, partial [Podila clonocystis]
SSGTSVPNTPTSTAEPPTSTNAATTTTAPTTTTTTTTTTTIIPPTTTITTIPTIPITTTVPTIPTTTTSSIRTTPTTVRHSTIPSTTLISTTTTLLPTPGGSSSSSSSNNNIPVIVGSIAGVAVLAIILITSISCYRRRRRANRELTFDALGLGNTGGKRNTIPFSSNKPAGAIGLNSATSGGYDDDDYGYDMQHQGGNGYPSPHQSYNNQHQQQFNTGYDVYGQGVHPTIFNEDHHGAYATASSMSKNRRGFDQNLPEVMYRNGEEDQVAAAATGYYDDTGYDVAWNQQIDPNAHYGHGQGGYVNGLWVANPEGQYYGQEQYQDPYQQQQQQQQQHHEFYDEPLDPLTPPAPSRPVITSAQSKLGENRNSFNNPQAILPATSAVGGSEGEGSQLRSHDLFVQTSEAPAVTGRKSQSPPASPSSRLREMRSMELASQSPTSRPSGEGGRTYADDVQGGGSPTGAGGATLNGQKSLRSRRREDWS